MPVTRSTAVLALALAAAVGLGVWDHVRLSDRIARLESRPEAPAALPPRPMVAPERMNEFVETLTRNVVRSLEKAHRGIATTQIESFADAIQRYRMDNHGKLPASLEDLTQRTDRNPEPIMVSIPKDPWDNVYEYRILSNKEFTLRSAGEDGIPDNEDDLVWPAK